MKLGILVNTDRHLAAVIGIARAALEKGHEALLFAMDEGTRLLAEPDYVALCRSPGVKMSFCHESAARAGVDVTHVPPSIVSGSQLHNAMMVHDADRIIVL